MTLLGGAVGSLVGGARSDMMSTTKDSVVWQLNLYPQKR